MSSAAYNRSQSKSQDVETHLNQKPSVKVLTANLLSYQLCSQLLQQTPHILMLAGENHSSIQVEVSIVASKRAKKMIRCLSHRLLRLLRGYLAVFNRVYHHSTLTFSKNRYYLGLQQLELEFQHQILSKSRQLNLLQLTGSTMQQIESLS